MLKRQYKEKTNILYMEVTQILNINISETMSFLRPHQVAICTWLNIWPDLVKPEIILEYINRTNVILVPGGINIVSVVTKNEVCFLLKTKELDANKDDMQVL